jgi:hypothetical protein
MHLGSRSSLLPALLLSASLLATNASAGVTGVPGINDYTINTACASGSMSCTPCNYVSPLTMNFDVSTAPGAPVVFAFTFCPCSPDFVFLPPVSCALPFTSFGTTSNQSIDLTLGCVITFVSAAAAATGVASVSFPVPTLSAPITLGTQAAVVGLPCAVPSAFVMTQAYSLTII